MFFPQDVAICAIRFGPKSEKSTSKSERDKEYDKNKRQWSYRKEWESDFKWLAYDDN